MSPYHRPDEATVQELKDLANKLRIHSIQATDASKSGHPTSCCSMAEIISVLFFRVMKYRVEKPKAPENDRFVLSKGHAAPILYAAWAEAGLFPVSDLLNLRKVDNDLEGHPTPRLNFIDVATGSLGQGLSCACGMAYTGKYYDKGSYRVYCVLGDGESTEGSVWEALHFASNYKLDNLVAIVDVNRLGQSDPTSLQHDTEVYKKRLEAFGWNTVVIDGHDIEALCKSLHEAGQVTGRPSAIIAKTYKGRGCPGVEDLENWHGKPLGDKSKAAIETIRSNISDNKRKLCITGPAKDVSPAVKVGNLKMSSPPNYTLGQQVATRLAYGTALAKMGEANPTVIAMDGDTKNSTFSIKLRDKRPAQYIECYIAEQNLVGVAIGCGTRGRTIPFASTFACFLSRAYDQIRMGAISQANVKLCGSHAGVSIGEDGPSQMALEDLAMFRAIPNAIVFYPSDAVSCERAVELAANTPGIVFIRTSRPNMAVLYNNDEVFTIGKAKVVRKSEGDQATIVASAVTLVESLKAANILKEGGINVRVIDPFTIKPLDKDTILANARQTGGKVITVEDHYPEGGIGEAVAAALSTKRNISVHHIAVTGGIGEAVAAALSAERNISVHRLAVTGIPRSGTCDQLLNMFGISAACIVKKVKEIL